MTEIKDSPNKEKIQPKGPDQVEIMLIACARSVNLERHLKAYELDDVDNCKVIQVPCSGMIQPRMIETAFKEGADGVLVMGCQLGDCHYREGNKFCRERLLGQRPPVIKKSVPKNRLQGLWMSEVQYSDLKKRIENFKIKVSDELRKEAEAL